MVENRIPELQSTSFVRSRRNNMHDLETLYGSTKSTQPKDLDDESRGSLLYQHSITATEDHNLIIINYYCAAQYSIYP
jgi:hypothetical protein